MKRRVIPLLLAILMVVSLLPAASAVSGYAGGSGTRNDPYLIATAEQLAMFRDEVNKGNSSLCAKLVADIDMGGVSWTPIGLTQKGYSGLFDGCGHLVSNLRIDKISNEISVTTSLGKTFKGIRMGGLFGVIGSDGLVRCVGIGGVVTGSIVSKNKHAVYLGSLVGCSFGTVEECFSTCEFKDLSISNNNFIGTGGLVGCCFSGAIIQNCYNTGSVSATIKCTSSSSKNVYVGGLIGYADCQVRNCYVAAPVTVNSNGNLYLGGITGIALLEENTDKFSNFYFDNQVCTSTGATVGGYNNQRDQDPPGCGGRTTDVLRSSQMPGILGNVFRQDTQWINKGYPILAVMTYGLEDETWSSWFEDEAFGTNIDQEVFQKLIPAELKSKNLTLKVTRLEFCAIAVQLYEAQGGVQLDPTQLTVPFTDANFADVVKKAYALGLTNGVTPTTFDPYSNISRQDLATMLTRVYKALNLPGWTLAKDSEFVLDYTGVTPFADDMYISAYAKPSVYFMVKNQVIKGLTQTEFGPRNTNSEQEALSYANASREQALIMAVRMFKKL